MLDGEHEPRVAEYLFDLALGYEFDSNSIGKIGCAKLQEVMKVNSVVKITNNDISQRDYEIQIEADHYNR
jgi:hypothetical protein